MKFLIFTIVALGSLNAKADCSYYIDSSARILAGNALNSITSILLEKGWSAGPQTNLRLVIGGGSIDNEHGSMSVGMSDSNFNPIIRASVVKYRYPNSGSDRWSKINNRRKASALKESAADFPDCPTP